MPDTTIIGGGSDESRSEEQTPEELKAAEEKAAEEKAAAEEGKSPEEIKAAEEAKAAEEKAAEEKKDGAPEEYIDFKMPKGMEVDKGMLETFAPLAKELNLSQEKAQKLVDLQAKGLEASRDAHVKEWADAMGKWKDDVKADKEIGGESYNDTERYAGLALKKLGPANREDGTNALQSILEVTGVGNHVELVRFFAKVGKLIDDDKIDLGNVMGEGPKSHAETLYPNQGQT